MKDSPPLEFQVLVASGQVEATVKTVELQLEVSDIMLGENLL